MYYPEEIVEEVRMKNDIVDVVGSYVKIQKKGNSYFGCCPFHNEKTPSFSVSGSKQMYYCFGCGAGGNVFTFVMNYENYSFVEAVKMLADRAGVKLPELEYSEEMKKKENHRARLLEVNKESAKYYYYQLRSKRGEVGLKYLQDRQLTEETMKKFGLGYATDGLCRYLKEKGYEDKLIKEAGVAGFDERRGLHDTFWNRVMFPIQDINHRVIGFGGRVMGKGEPKYLNSPETPIFDKRRNLYGMNFARTAKAGNLIICEGYMDVISMHQAGFTQAVASLGTAFTTEQASLMKRYTDKVLLAYDSDGAGTKAALRAIGILRQVGLTGKVINMQPYKDPDEFIKNLGAEEFQKRIDQAENSFMFEVRISERDYDLNDPEGKTAFHREIAKKLCAFEDEVERENYLEAVTDKYHIGFENMRKLVNSYASKTGLVQAVERPKSGIHSKPSREENADKVQRMLLTWITDYPEILPKIEKYIAPSDFTVELYRKVAERLFSDMKAGKYNPASIISMFTDEEEQRMAAALFNTKVEAIETKQEKERAFHDILYAVKKNSYEYYSGKLGTDVNALNQVIAGKKALEELGKMHISLD
ncbi:MAG: DNA primase [Lachnospiraceae bacterium]